MRLMFLSHRTDENKNFLILDFQTEESEFSLDFSMKELKSIHDPVSWLEVYVSNGLRSNDIIFDKNIVNRALIRVLGNVGVI